MAFVISPILSNAASRRGLNVSPRARPVVSATVKPLADRVLVRVDKAMSESSSGLFLGDAEEKQKTGTVVAVGPGRRSPGGTVEKIFLEEGDQVLWKDEYGAESIESDDDTELLALRAYSIIGKI